MSIDAKEKKKLKIHAKHHTKKHIAMMSAMMNGGKTFKQAHLATLKIEQKQRNKTT